MQTNRGVLVLLIGLLLLTGVTGVWQVKKVVSSFARNKVENPVQLLPRNVRPAPVRSATPIKESLTQETEIPVTRPTEMSGWSKAQVFAHRKQAMENSIFESESYEPSKDVFGQIENGKPWIAMTVCQDRDTKSLETKGPSEEDRFIANPSMLVAVEWPFLYAYNGPSLCTDDMYNLMPVKISYNPEEREISVTYSEFPLKGENMRGFYTFNGVNARDLGYHYVYVDKDKTTLDMSFDQPENASTQVVAFQNFIHVGGACGVKGGCNNGSPRQPMLEFRALPASNPQGPKEIFLKLWKEKPASTSDPANLTERIIVQNP